MSRFKPGISEPRSSLLHSSYSAPVSTQAAPVLSSLATKPEPPKSFEPVRPQAPHRPNMFESLGFWSFCIYQISASLTDLLTRFLGRIYVSTVALIAVPIFWLFSTTRFRALRHPMGRWWAAFAILLIIDLPFSVWRHGTFDMLVNYIPRSYLILFYITAFALSFERCRTLMHVGIIAASAELFIAVKFGGYSEDGRYRVTDSIFAGNSNGLAMMLLLGAITLSFLFYEKGIFKKLYAAMAMTVSVIYILRTGSRGCLLAAICYAALIFVLSRQKMITLALALVFGVVGVATVPSLAMGRLMLLFSSAPTTDASAVQSQEQRVILLKRSLLETVKHPLFGVGPEQFAVAVAGEKLKRGEYAPWLGTHNSFTQVSSECGIPAFVCYCAVIFYSLRLNYRLLKASRKYPEYAKFEGFAATLLSSMMVYCICTFFFHMAYTGTLPGIAGLTLAVHYAAQEAMGEDYATVFAGRSPRRLARA